MKGNNKKLQILDESSDDSIDFSKNPTAKNADKPVKGSFLPPISPLGVPNILFRKSDKPNDQVKMKIRKSILGAASGRDSVSKAGDVSHDHRQQEIMDNLKKLD